MTKKSSLITSRYTLLSCVLGEQLKRTVESGSWGLDTRLEALKKQTAIEFGYIMPDIRFKADSDLDDEGYEIHIHGSRYGKGEIRRDKTLVIGSNESLSSLDGETTKEPAYGLPALWIGDEQRTIAQSQSNTLVEPEMVIFTHIAESIKK